MTRCVGTDRVGTCGPGGGSSAFDGPACDLGLATHGVGPADRRRGIGGDDSEVAGTRVLELVAAAAHGVESLEAGLTKSVDSLDDGHMTATRRGPEAVRHQDPNRRLPGRVICELVRTVGVEFGQSAGSCDVSSGVSDQRCSVLR